LNVVFQAIIPRKEGNGNGWEEKQAKRKTDVSVYKYTFNKTFHYYPL
jgi:hypothetical protein